MSEDRAIKYLDIDSSYRNRNNYPNPYDFVIPYSFPNKGTTTLEFLDPILDSSPYTGSPSLTPGELVTGISFMNSTTEITLDSRDSPIDNFYINSTLQIGTQYRSIINYNGTTKVCKVSNPFFSVPDPGTVYYIRRIETYFNSDVNIYRYSNPKYVDQLNLLTAAPSPVKDFYKGSYIRFSNGPHVGETSLITRYDPFNNLVIWNQDITFGSNEFLDQTVKAVRFLNSIPGNLNNIVLKLISVGSRTITITVKNGTELNGAILCSESFPVPDTLTVTDFLFEFTNKPLLVSSQYYTITFQDLSQPPQGFINIFGIVPSFPYISYNWNVYPAMTISVSNLPESTWLQPTVLGSTDYISTTQYHEYDFTPTSSGVLTTIGLSVIAFETVSSGRTLNIKIKENGTVIYTTDSVLSNTPKSVTDVKIEIPPVYLTTGTQYSLCIKDTTAGGELTGFVNIFGIEATPGYISRNTLVYPKMDMTMFSDNKLIGTGRSGTNKQGSSVAVSGDGTTLAVGGYGGSIGSTWVYTYSNGEWIQQGDPIVGSGSSGFSLQGFSVSLSYNGNTLAVGGYGDNSSRGAVWVFIRIDGVWTQQGGKIVGDGYVGVSQQGKSVCLSNDGNTLVIGGPGDNSSKGAVWVYIRSGGIWTFQSKLVGTGGIGVNLYQGTSVSITGDGNTVVSGATGDNNTGAAWVFTRSGSIWTEKGKLTGGSVVGAPNKGSSVSISNDGTTIAVGGPNDNSLLGAVWIFILSGGVWTQQSKIVGTGYTGSVIQQGTSCSLSADGNTLIVGGSNDNSGLGAVWMFTRSNGVWTQQKKIVGNNSIGLSRHGYSCCINHSGNRIVEGGVDDDINTGLGASWVYSIGEIFSQPSNPVVSSVVSVPIGFKFIASTTGIISDVNIDLSSFESLDDDRSILLKVSDDIGEIYSNSFIIPNSKRSINTISIYSENIVSGNTYTLTLEDTSSVSTGSVYLYGITPDSTYITLNGTVYPRMEITTSTIDTTFIQPSNPTIYDHIDSTEKGFSFSPIFNGKISEVSLSLTSFGDRTVHARVLDGSGLGGILLYETDIIIENTYIRTDYKFSLNTEIELSNTKTYTISFSDTGVVGGVTFYGKPAVNPYNSYNTSVYPKMSIKVPSFIITISPPKIIDGFLTPGSNAVPNNIEFNSQARENATTLFYNGQPLSAQYYKIGLKYLILPNRVLKVSRGGKLDVYPYVYVQLYNDGNRGALNVISSTNPNAALAIFKCPIDKNLYDMPGSFFTLKHPVKDQIIKFRPDQNIRIVITLPDGTTIQNSEADTLSPLFPNPLLQVNALFTLLPIDKYDHIYV